MSRLSPTELLDQLKSLTSDPPQSLVKDDILRAQFYHAARDAMIAFEDAPGPITRVAVAQAAEWVTMCVCCQMGLYPALADNDEPKSLSQLVDMTKADAVLLLRFLRASVCFGAVKEIGTDSYILSPSYAQLGNPTVAAALPKFADFVHGTFYALPPLLARNGHQNPADPLNTTMQLAFNAPGKAPYEIFGSMPEHAKAIGILLNAMGTKSSQRIENVYPVQARLLDGYDGTISDVLFVDIGAGNGHVVSGLKEAFPQLPGRLIAQDLQGMIATAPSVTGVEMQAYDFFTEQPIKNARTYYIRLCLHNWQDEACIAILTRIREAMKPGYSRLIIHEQVMLQRGSFHIWAAVSDISQMGACASKERTEREWGEVLMKAGFQKPTLYSPGDPSAEVAIESEVEVRGVV